MATGDKVTDLHVVNFSATRATLPADCIRDNQVADGADIAAEKVIHQYSLNYDQAPGSNVVAATKLAHICQAAGEIVAVEAMLTGVIPSGDRSATVDVLRSTAGGAFASVLASVITNDSTNTIRVAKAGTVSSGTLADGDAIEIVIALGAGVTGTNPQGLLVTVTIQEESEP